MVPNWITCLNDTLLFFRLNPGDFRTEIWLASMENCSSLNTELIKNIDHFGEFISLDFGFQEGSVPMILFRGLLISLLM